MKEFMTQDKMIWELVELIAEKKRIKTFYTRACQNMSPQTANVKLPHIDIMKEKLFNFLRKNGKSKILDMSFLYDVDMGLTNHDEKSDWERIVRLFILRFAKKHKEEIIQQYEKTVKLFIRYVRETSSQNIFNLIYGSKHAFMENRRKIKDTIALYHDFPFLATVLSIFASQGKAEIIYELRERFRAYYIKQMT